MFEDGRVLELDQGRPVPRNLPAEWGDCFVMQSDARPAGVSYDGATRPDAAPAGAEPYVLELTRGEVSITRTDRPGGLPYRRLAEGRSPHSNRRHAWDMVERITERRERSPRGGQTRTYQYDNAGRLARVLYDGGLAETYQYDARGRREREGNGRRGFLERRYVYGPDGRLLAAQLPDGRAIEYTHDQHGRRAEKKVNGRTVERYEWLDRIRLSKAVSDGAKMEFLYSGTRLPDMMVRDGRTYRLHYDQVGSLRVVAAGLGNAVKELVYDSFGNILEDTNPAFRVPIGFAGGLYDPDTNLIRFGHRDYDPDTGRFTALDPLGDAGGDADWYGYCLDDPVNLVDPEGLESSEEHSLWDTIRSATIWGLKPEERGSALGGVMHRELSYATEQEKALSKDDGAASCLSGEGTVFIPGFRLDAGAGACWDSNGQIRGMTHVDTGASNGWGAGVSAGYQATNAKSIDDLSGSSWTTGGSINIPTEIGTIGMGFDKIKGTNYSGVGLSGGLSVGKPNINVEIHTKRQTSWLNGKDDKDEQD